METDTEKLARVMNEHVEVGPYDPRWPVIFEQEQETNHD